MHFIQNLSLHFHSFLHLYLNGNSSSVDNNRWYRISTSYWVKNLQLSSCLSIESTHEFKWYNTWMINSRSSKTFNLVYTDISKNVFIWKMWFSYLLQSYDSLSDNFFVIHASLYYRDLLLVLALLVNFAFYQP